MKSCTTLQGLVQGREYCWEVDSPVATTYLGVIIRRRSVLTCFQV
jgi:hypothetical protein